MNSNFFGTSSLPGLLPVVAGFIFLRGGIPGGISEARASEEVRLETVFSDNRGRPAHGKLHQGGDGWLYGTTPGGGLAGKGTVFRVSHATGELVTLGCFNGGNGATPNPGLARADDGSWYGTTPDTNDGGSTIFRVGLDGGLSTMIRLSGLDVIGAGGLVRGRDGNFYGVSAGAGRYGNVFRMSPSGAIETLAFFSGTSGKYPGASLVEGSDGNFYGTTMEGGDSDWGTAFKMSPSGSLIILASFPPAPGRFRLPALAEGADGYFYGTTSRGGLNDAGTVFQLAPAGGLTTMLSFNYTNGSEPMGGLIRAADGSLYGTTRYGGIHGKGTIFKISPAGSFSLITSFNYTTPGPFTVSGGPLGELVQASDGNFYGITGGGGGNDNGTIFRMTPAGVLSTVATFNPALGSFSSAPLLAARDGSLYGTAGSGGDQGFGTIFKVTPGGVFSRLFSFTGTNGAFPNGGLIQADDGHFYGTTAGDYSYSGSLFRMMASGAVSTLAPFPGVPGQRASVIQLSDGNFYGTTSRGGNHGMGMVYRATPAAVLTTLASFDPSGPSGFLPDGPLMEARDGFLYGTALGGGLPGASSYGTVYKISRSGQFTTAGSFDGTNNGRNPNTGLIQTEDEDFLGTMAGGIFKMTASGQVITVKEFLSTSGASSYAELIQGQDGLIYGTTRDGGTGGLGSIFKMTLSGEVTTLASFHGTDGSRPTAKMVQTPDGHFYGTTETGGTQDLGTLYRMTAAGTLTSVLSFNRSNGAYPKSSLVADATGAVFGTAYEGGSSNRGTVFRMSPQGQFTTLVHFGSGNGAYPWGGLLLGQDGNLYGTTSNFTAPDQYGSIFKMTPEGNLTRLAGLSYEDGAYPKTALVQDPAGNFYGTTSNFGPGGKGTIFKMTSAGAISRLVSFDGTNGGYPSAALVPGPDGNLYGTTLSDLNAPNAGTIFRMTPQGQLTRIQAFPTDRSRLSRAGLMTAADGLLYGTTRAFGQTGGTVFSMTTDGVMKTLATFDGVRAASLTSGLVKARDANYYGTTRDGGKDGFGMIYSMTTAGEVKTLASFDGITAASPKGPPVVGPDGDLYGTADQLVVWRLVFPPVQSKAATSITTTGTLLHGTVNPKNQGTAAAGFQFGTDPALVGASTVSAGSVPDGGMASPISSSLTNLLPGTVYYYRATAGAATAHTGKILSFQTLTYFQSWRLLHFGGTADSGDAASAADPDGDGLSNLMEFAVGSHPKTASPGPIGMQRGPAGLELNYARNKEAIAAGLLYTVEWSDDLNPAVWSNAGVVQLLIQDLTTEQQFKAWMPSGEARRFARLRVGLP